MWRQYLRDLVRPDIDLREDASGVPVDFLAELDQN